MTANNSPTLARLRKYLPEYRFSRYMRWAFIFALGGFTVYVAYTDSRADVERIRTQVESQFNQHYSKADIDAFRADAEAERTKLEGKIDAMSARLKNVEKLLLLQVDAVEELEETAPQ